jgi:hypothetical protein
MASQLQLRRGTTAQHGPFIGAPGEVTVDTDKKTTVVHDGATAGGFPLSRESVIATGSVTRRSISDRFADAVNVKDFGAVGDGVADDRAAFVAAANAATAQSKRLIIPSGTYNISGGGLIPVGDIRIESYGTITGAGAAFGANNCPFGTGNFQFHKMGTYQNVLQFDRWNVNATDAEAHSGIAVFRRYDGRANTSAYYQSGTPIYGYLHYGEERAALAQKASGTANAVCGFINVFSLDNGTGGGRSEIVPMAGAVSCSPTASITAGGNYYNEFSINGPTGTSESDPQREAFLAGACYLVQKYCPGNTKDSSHEGSYGITVTTRPGNGGFDFSRPANVQNYKLFAGVAINGWSGVNGTATDGHSASAASAYEWGIIIGGHGSAWTPFNSNSKIDNGIGIKDFVNTGLYIFGGHPHRPASSAAINVAADAGICAFGFAPDGADTATKIQIRTDTQYAPAIRVWASSHATSERAGMYLGDWLLNQDILGNGTKDFGLWDGARSVLKVDPTGNNPIYLWTDGALKNVTVGAADSGGTGFKVLRVPN